MQSEMARMQLQAMLEQLSMEQEAQFNQQQMLTEQLQEVNYALPVTQTNTYGPNGAFGNASTVPQVDKIAAETGTTQPTVNTQPATQPASNWRPGGMFGMGAYNTTQPVTQPVTQPITQPATAPVTQPITQPISTPYTGINTFGSNGAFAPKVDTAINSSATDFAEIMAKLAKLDGQTKKEESLSGSTFDPYRTQQWKPSDMYQSVVPRETSSFNGSGLGSLIRGA